MVPIIDADQRSVPESGTTSPLTTETVFKTLGSRRRRYTLHYLRQMQREISIRDLSEQLAAWEHTKERDEVTPKERKRLYTALHQSHLPKMDALNVVDYDRNRGVVSLTEHIDQFDIYLDVVATDDLPWGQFYLALGGVLTALVAVAASGITPFTLLNGFDYAFVVVVLFTAVAAYQTIRDRKQVVGKNGDPPDVCHPPEELTEADRN